MTSQGLMHQLVTKLDALDALSQRSNEITFHIHHVLSKQKDLILQRQTRDFQNAHINPLNQYGQKCFSQHDEDGITLEIVRRMGIEKGFYGEFGVGNGLENNTLILAALGWKGFWVGGEDLVFDFSLATRFQYTKTWVTMENILEHYKNGVQFLKHDIDVASLDFDGNDLFFVEHLLSHHCLPKLFIVEYNAKFPPPVQFHIAYDPHHTWKGDDYFGASLASFAELFSRFHYKLVCCNQTGANAFFVRGDLAHLFEDVPKAIKDIYVSPHYHLCANHGHSVSAQTVANIINRP